MNGLPLNLIHRISLTVLTLAAALLLAVPARAYTDSTPPVPGEIAPPGVDAMHEPPEDIPVPPPFFLPPPETPGVFVVANEEYRRKELIAEGYDPYWTITDAVDAAGDGDIICITKGEYFENVSLNGRHYMSFIGEEGALVVSPNDMECVFMSACSAMYFCNLDTVHQYGESPCGHNCYEMWNCSDVLIEYCDISGCGYYGVAMYNWEGMTDIRVENCAIHDCFEAVHDESGGALSTKNLVLWNNGDQGYGPEVDGFGNQYLGWLPEAPVDLPQVPVYNLPGPDPMLFVACNDRNRREHLRSEGYQCFATIQSAINGAPDYGMVAVMSGEYYENLVIEGRHGLQIIGEKHVVVVADNDEDVVFVRESTEIAFENIDTVHEVGESPCLHNCFVIWDCQGVAIYGCDISGCGYIGVEVLGNGNPEAISVFDCTIHDCVEAFYDVSGGSLYASGNVLWNIEEYAPLDDPSYY